MAFDTIILKIFFLCHTFIYILTLILNGIFVNSGLTFLFLNIAFVPESIWRSCLQIYFCLNTYKIKFVFATSGRYFGWVRTKFAHPVNGQGRHQWRRKARKVSCAGAKHFIFTFIYLSIYCVFYSKLAHIVWYMCFTWSISFEIWLTLVVRRLKHAFNNKE